MSYVRCISNKAFLHVAGRFTDDEIPDLTVGAVYKVLPTSERETESGLIRIIDNSGEDYLYPASHFEPLDLSACSDQRQASLKPLTIHLDPLTKAMLRAEALAAHKPMSTLVRQWVEERLDLATDQDDDRVEPPR